MTHETRTRTAVSIQLAIGTTTAALLLIPLWAVLRTTTYDALYGWIFGAVGGVILLAVLVRLLGARPGAAVVAVTAGFWAVTAVTVLWIIAAIGDPPGNSAIVFLAGVPAGAVAVSAAVAVLRRVDDELNGLIATGVLAIGVSIGAGFAAPVGEALADARNIVAQQEEMEAAGFTPYLPEVDGIDPRFSGVTAQVAEDGTRTPISYGIFYGTEEATGFWSVDVELTEYSEGCVEDDYTKCTEMDGWVLRDWSGDQYAVADKGSTTITVGLVGGSADGLPSLEEMGDAIAAAEPTDWPTVLGADGYTH